MDEDELKDYEREKEKMKEIYKGDDVKYFPVIIKSSSAGTLETLLKETDKIIKDTYRVNIIETGVGPITEGDLSNAS
jgi:translation initiation factor IF-2